MSVLKGLWLAAAGQVGMYSPLGRWIQRLSMTVNSLVGPSLEITFPQLRPSTASAPTPAEAGPTLGWLMAIGNFVYAEIPLNERVDRSRNIELHLAWAPAGAEVGTTVTWSLDLGFEFTGKDVSVIDLTKTILNIPIPEVSAVYQETEFVLTPAEWATNPLVDEIHVRIGRLASASDPILPPGVHHLEVLQPLLNGVG